jgi:hypothetical protein
VPEQGEGEARLAPEDPVDAVGERRRVVDGRFHATVLSPRVLDGQHIDVGAQFRGHREKEGCRPARVREADQPRGRILGGMKAATPQFISGRRLRHATPEICRTGRLSGIRT